MTCEADTSNAFTLMSVEDGDYGTLVVLETVFPADSRICFLYCSIVEGSNIDERQSRLLEIVPLGASAPYNWYEPVHLKFRQIAIHAFSDITFELRDD